MARRGHTATAVTAAVAAGIDVFCSQTGFLIAITLTVKPVH